ncbi:SusD/RagB family nutrient-binding outer membrane lipoprotein [Mucilaginibacter litoreus]|uniref:SusD/RagB family nutrient-binding outer membrane lipoprotein n=1 Tax=Mucilaginibacter litoreus TaxID=1048221 RepID=A0ABW3ANZ0_9SPHI
MKKISFKKHILLTLAACAIAGSGCKKALDINHDPNNLSEDRASIETLFPSAILSTIGGTHASMAVVGGMWAQFWAQSATASQYRDLDSFLLNPTSGYINRPYNELYTGALLDLNSVIAKAKAQEDWRYYLMATVLKVYAYEVLVDLYDKVPYTEALQGDKFIQPKFDDGYTIYKSLLADLDEALSHDFAGAAPFKSNQTKGDFIFGDQGAADFEEEMENWEKFANTLKLKMYLRMVNAKPTEAEAGIRAMIDGDKNFLNVGAGVTTFTDAPNASNPFYESNVRKQNTQTNLRASYTMVSWLKANNDPRIEAYYGSANPKYINQGNYGTTSLEEQQAAVAVQKATDPAWLISKPESYFLQAEANERYYGGNDAEQLYNEGVRASFVENGLTEAQADALLAGPYAYPANGTFEQKLEAIIVQKWASLFGSHAIEAFLEKNRTGYPRTSDVYSTDAGYVPGRLVIVPQSAIGQKLPKRFLFPDVERSRNINTPAEVPISNPVWWGK